VIYSYNKSQRDALFLNLNLVKNSTCFGQICFTIDLYKLRTSKYIWLAVLHRDSIPRSLVYVDVVRDALHHAPDFGGVIAATPPKQQRRCILTDYFINYNFSKLK